ncbi:hypothetical protein QE152_g4490 [Popillia japonica]|uniref:Uncharacterized protein n=1 Tax=Popillia japonica TaxID=7064 RepID=A0AAW1MUL7_POPJA
MQTPVTQSSFITEIAPSRDWKKRLSLRDNRRSNKEGGTLRRGSGRRWASLKQHPMSCSEQLVSGGSTPSTITASPSHETPRKSNWQVIEHFGAKDKNTLSSSLIATTPAPHMGQPIPSRLHQHPEEILKKAEKRVHIARKKADWEGIITPSGEKKEVAILWQATGSR